jgi:hypothetical protein
MKKILALLLAVSMVFALAACGNNDGAKKEDAPAGVKMNLETRPTSAIDYVLKTEFYYPENSGITVEYNETDCIALADEGDGYIMMLKIAEDEDYEYTKDWVIETYGEEAIKDVKLGELDAYMYCGLDSYNLCALLEKDATEEGHRYVTIEIGTPCESEEEIVKFVNDNTEIQHILKSFKYIGEEKKAE